MLNMGFVDDVEKILNAGGGDGFQTLLFSATLPAWVKDIQKRFLRPDFKLVDLVGNQKQKACPSHTQKLQSSTLPEADHYALVKLLPRLKNLRHSELSTLKSGAKKCDQQTAQFKIACPVSQHAALLTHL